MTTLYVDVYTDGSVKTWPDDDGEDDLNVVLGYANKTVVVTASGQVDTYDARATVRDEGGGR